MKNFLLLIILFCCVPPQSVSGENNLTFQPYINDEPPKVVETIEKFVKDGVSVHKLKFLSRVVDGQDVIIYGILTKPVKPGKYPGVLVVHGGGGYADQVFPQAFSWAQKGYISFCQDQPGICGSKHRSSGPESSMLRCTTDPETLAKNTPFEGVVAALNGLRMLRSQPEVDTSRIGITGGSWGGYMTTIISGISGGRIKASFSHYGCGFYDSGSHWSAGIEKMSVRDRSRWLDNLDAGRWAFKIKSHFMLTSPTNDWYFWPGAMMKTYNAIPGNKNFCISANINHQLTFPGGTRSTKRGAHRSHMEVQWMNYYLKNIGDPFGKCVADKKVTRHGNNIKIGFTYQGVNPNEGVDIWYTSGETPSRSNYWKRIRVSEDAKGHYSGLIPVFETELPILWYAIAYDRLDDDDDDDREYSCSTTYQIVNPLSAGFKPEERRNEYFNEGFEELVDRWKKPFEESVKGKGRFSIDGVAAHNGSKGMRLTGEQTVRCYGLRGLAIKRYSKGITMWVRNPGQTEFDIQLMAEEPNNVRHYWVAHQANTGKKWVRVFVPWSQFIYQNNGEKPIELLSAGLGQLGFSTPVDANIYIDDISLGEN